jgi:hypothetical protein
MKIFSVISWGAILFLLIPLNVWSVTIDYNSSLVPIDKNVTWDNPATDKFEQVISSLFPGPGTLTLVNGISGETETWYGTGVHTEILQEIAGYENNTTFGWYDRSNPAAFGEIFEGSDSNGDSEDTSFT